MLYSIVGILAIFVHLIVNIDIFFNVKGKKKFPGEKYFLFFLLSVIAYHITDGLWGILYDNKLVLATSIDTTVYFLTMAISILFWGIFVNHYLGVKHRVMTYAGIGTFVFQVVLIIINLFYPVLFTISEDCTYKALTLRYLMLTVQILMFLTLSLYTFIYALRGKASIKRRYFTITIFGLLMTIAIIFQVIFPLLPFYSLGYLFGVCVLHSFVVADERSKQDKALKEAKFRVSFDQLTGALSKYAYVDMENAIDRRIGEGDMSNFAVVVFDLNDLKRINDNEGHEKGDEYIISAVKLIKEYFPKNPIYRIGGDEFVVTIMGKSWKKKEIFVDSFNEHIDQNLKNKEMIIISAGMAVYDPKVDNTISQVFSRADALMYERKRYLKGQKNKKGA